MLVISAERSYKHVKKNTSFVSADPTINLRKAHVTSESIGPAIWAISVQRAIK